MAAEKKQKFTVPSLPKVDIKDLTVEQLEYYHTEKAAIESCIELAKKLEVDEEYIPLASEVPAFDRLMGTDQIERAVVVRDPSRGKNPTLILQEPPGKKLYWATPKLRDDLGWDHLVPVMFDDPIGREIERYLPEVPEMLAGSAKREGVIRRGDAVLAWIDEGIWEARQKHRVTQSYQRINQVANAEQVPIRGGGAHTIGDGLQPEGRPRQGFAPGTRSGRDVAESEGGAPAHGHTSKSHVPGAGEKF